MKGEWTIAQLRDTILIVLRNHVCQISYTKKDTKEVITIKGTLMIQHIPEKERNSQSPNYMVNAAERPDIMCVRAVDLNCWKTLRLASLEECIVLE